MNGFHFAHLVGRFARLSQPRRLAISSGLIVSSLIVIGLVWFLGSPRHGSPNAGPNAVHTTLADSPSWGQARAGWPKYMPDVPAAATPSVAYAPAETVATPPSIAAGPELFAPTIQPLPAANIPSQFLVSRPTGLMPVPRPVHSESMEKIAVQSDQQVRHGFELADHGAYFAARAEFINALRLIAQGLDDTGNTTFHSQALSAALTAMKEAQDFIPAGGKLEGELDLPPIIASHRTPVLKNVSARQLPVMRALKQYFTFAQQQFAVAAGREVSASMALGALGKLHSAMAGKPNPEIVAPETKAIVFFQAAILVCPQNYMAANDLGVLLARCGDYAGARRLLEHSVLACRCSENLNNLSVVYRQVGQQRLADLAAGKAQMAKAGEIARQKGANLSAGGTVEWVNPAALAQSADQWADPAARSAATAGQQAPASARPVVGQAPAPYGPAMTR